MKMSIIGELISNSLIEYCNKNPQEFIDKGHAAKIELLCSQQMLASLTYKGTAESDTLLDKNDS